MIAKATEERCQELKSNIEAIRAQIREASKGKGKEPRLVLVSKLKPPSDILAAHESAGHDHFGENYIQELQNKAQQLPPTIKWHFVGQLQSNKAKALASIPNLHTLETLDSAKKADIIERTLAEEGRRLRVFLQLNTSGEEQKGGVSSTDELQQLADHVKTSCPHLDLVGLMTIGSYEPSPHDESSPNPDFVRLREARDALGDPSLELSMGMSADFEHAIQQGSTNVRVGSSAFGARPSKEEAKHLREAEKA